MTQQATGVDWSFMNAVIAPEGMTVPGSMFPLGKIGMKLTGYEWIGKKSGTQEVLGLRLDLEVVETAPHTGETVSESLFVGQTADPQRGEVEDLYAQDPETQKRRLKLVTAIARSVGVGMEGNSFGNILNDCLNRPFVGQTRARTTKDGTFVNLKTAYEWDPAVIMVDTEGMKAAHTPAAAVPGAPPPPPSRQAPPLGTRTAPPQGAPQAPPQQQAAPVAPPVAPGPPQMTAPTQPAPPPSVPGPPPGMPTAPAGSRIPPR